MLALIGCQSGRSGDLERLETHQAAPINRIKLMGGLLDVGRWAVRAALSDDITGAAFTAAALGSDTEFELDLVEAHACAGMANYFTVRDAAADTDDHGESSVEVGFSEQRRRRERRLRAQITMPVTDNLATITPISDIRMRPGIPRIRPECKGSCS